MPLPFELEPQDLDRHLEELVDGVFASLQSQFLVRPRGKIFSLATLDLLVEHTRLREFLPRSPP